MTPTGTLTRTCRHAFQCTLLLLDHAIQVYLPLICLGHLKAGCCPIWAIYRACKPLLDKESSCACAVHGFCTAGANTPLDPQAMDRCHRIGQQKPVLVFRLATAHSVEGKLLRRARSKLALERLVIKKGAFLPGETVRASLSTSILLPIQTDSCTQRHCCPCFLKRLPLRSCGRCPGCTEESSIIS